MENSGLVLDRVVQIVCGLANSGLDKALMVPSPGCCFPRPPLLAAAKAGSIDHEHIKGPLLYPPQGADSLPPSSTVAKARKK